MQKQEDPSDDKFFDTKEYNTIMLSGSEEQKKNAGKINELVLLLSSDDIAGKDAALALLKKEKGTTFLMEAIGKSKSNSNKILLLAACWESGLDFRGHHAFFLKYVLEQDPMVSLEALTVLDQLLDTIPGNELPQLVQELDAAIANDHPNAPLFQDLKNNMEGI